LTELESKSPKGKISSDVRDPSSLKLDLGEDGIGIFVGSLGASILHATNVKFLEKNYPITMKALMDQLEVDLGEDIPSRTAVLNKVIELGQLNALLVEEVTGHGGKKTQISPVKESKTLFRDMAEQTMTRLNEELQMQELNE